jgi:hypothetical protein
MVLTRTVHLLEQLTKPCRLGDAVSHSVVLDLGARARDETRRFEDQETRLSPRNMTKAQSASM